jgi:hypothetical protein
MLARSIFTVTLNRVAGIHRKMRLAAAFCFVFWIKETEQGNKKKLFSRRSSAMTPKTG